MLLSRVAENLYWAARYLERAEDTARVVREHTNLIVDLPTSVPLTWEPLLAIIGGHEEFDAAHETADELSIVRYLVSDRTNGGSILMSVEQARENLRTCREVVPREAWQSVNDLYLYVASHHTGGVARPSRSRFLERIVTESLRTEGFILSTMSRDEAYEFVRLGRTIERADMTTRVLDVSAGALMAAQAGGGGQYEDVQWMSVLRSLSALQMYHRTTRFPVEGPAALRFLLLDAAFPRSVMCCLADMADSVSRLPRSELVLPICDDARRVVADTPLDDLSAAGLHELADELQIALAAIHDHLIAAYVQPATVPL
jgi:uncharacterized alpha-E superfamily protein